MTLEPCIDTRRDSPWAFPWERRAHERTVVDLRARLHGPRGEIPVRTLNVSVSGTLLELDERDLCTVPPIVERSVLHGVARSLFGAHLEVTFLERGVSVGARLARMVCPPDATERLHLGLRFLETLSPLQLRRLGVAAADAAPAGGAGGAGATPATGTRLTATVRSLGGEDEEALATGVLLGIADHAVVFRDRGGDAGETVARLAGRPLSLAVQDGDAVLWSTTEAHLISVRVLDFLGGTVEATLLTDVDPAVTLGPLLVAASKPAV